MKCKRQSQTLNQTPQHEMSWRRGGSRQHREWPAGLKSTSAGPATFIVFLGEDACPRRDWIASWGVINQQVGDMTHDASQLPAVPMGKKREGKYLLAKILGYNPMSTA